MHKAYPASPSDLPLPIVCTVGMAAGVRLMPLDRDTPVRSVTTWRVHRLDAFGFEALVDGEWARATCHVTTSARGSRAESRDDRDGAQARLL